VTRGDKVRVGAFRQLARVEHLDTRHVTVTILEDAEGSRFLVGDAPWTFHRLDVRADGQMEIEAVSKDATDG